jgi:hypothetical protein
MKAYRIAQSIDQGMNLGTQSAFASTDGSLEASPPLPRHYAGGHARSSSQSWHIRCPHRGLTPQTLVATHHALPTD